MHKYSINPNYLRKCVLIWSVKNQELINKFQDTSLHEKNETQNERNRCHGSNEENGNISQYNDYHPFYNQFYVTNGAVDYKYNNSKKSQNIGQNNVIFSGRPNLPNIINEMSKLCMVESISRVAVVSCGPREMMVEVADLCAENQHGVAFDFYQESFEI